MKYNNRQILRGLAGLAFVFGGAAHAQTAGSTEEAVAEEETGDVIVPRMTRPDPTGVETAKTDGEIDWEALKREMEETQAEDAAVERQVRAMALSRVVTTAERDQMRPRGFRPAPAREMQMDRPERVERARLPVIIPLKEEIVNNARVAVQENTFTVFAELPGGAFFELIGTRLRVVGGTDEVMKSRAAERRREMRRLDSINAPYTLSRHERGVDLSFSKFNVAYQITIECNDPEADERCTKDDYIVSLTDFMGVLNPDGGAE